MQKTVFIFDFDGTIADTHYAIIAISNKLASEFNYRTIRPEEVESLKNKTSQEIIRHLKIPVLKIPAIVARAKKELRNNISLIEPIAELKPILISLKKLHITIGILSSNTSDNISKFLKNHELDFFDFIFTTPKIWSKHSSIKNILDKHKLTKKQVIYIGDEIRDIRAAKKLGVKVAAVGWGYNSVKVLQKQHPDFMLLEPADLIRMNASLSKKSSP